MDFIRGENVIGLIEKVGGIIPAGWQMGWINRLGSMQSVKELLQKLEGVSQQLELVCKEVEPHFMGLGDQLQTLYADSATMTKQLSDTVKAFGEGSEDSLLAQVQKQVRETLEDLKKNQSEMTGDLSQITIIIDSLHDLYKKCEMFEQTNIFIKVVGMNIGIESTRSMAAREMFTVVSDEIKKISENIIDITRNIMEDSKRESGSQMSTHSKISEGMNRLTLLAKDGEKTVRNAVLDIEELTKISISTLDQAGAHSREISRQVGEIVEGIQIHDSMTQRVEHIINSFQDANGLFSDEGETENEDPWSEKLRNAHSIISVQEGHLRQLIFEVEAVRQKTALALEKIKDEVGLLAETVTSFGLNMATESDKGGNEKADAIGILVKALHHLHKVHGQGKEMIESVRDAANHASKTANSLSSHTESVKTISNETHHMALNAIVKAAHLGEKGRTHEVLAQEMKALSDRSNLFVKEVENIIGAVVKASTEFGGRSHQDEALQENGCEQKVSLNWEVEEISRAYEGFYENSLDIGQRAEALDKSIAEAIEELSFLDGLRGSLIDHLEELCEIAGLLGGKKGKGNGGSSEMVGDGAERYTMNLEREIHEHVIDRLNNGAELFDRPEVTDEGGQVDFFIEDNNGKTPEELRVSDEGDGVEIFTDHTSGKADDPPEEKNEDLGENVELF